MSQKFSHVVMTAPFLVAKGFILGYMQGKQQEFPYFFHHKYGIKHESLGEMMREVLHMECHTHLCLPTSILPEFKKALGAAKDRLNMSIKSEQLIQSASFSFSYHIYTEERSGACKDLFRVIPEGVELLNYHPTELCGSGVMSVPEFGKINQYCYEGNGTAKGDFEAIIAFYTKIKQHSLCDSVLVSEIQLEYAA
ncbi:MAG: hypothetical protein EHM72_20990 [Calditrichaeota bacterium]|nr:MAG: hypothetical protein EHM72_20990 [Calditrichota bacterium]